jgi:ABC-type multidrug transport system ATPase subunit
MAGNAMFELENLTKRYREKLAVDGLDFVVQPGIGTDLRGPNGAGKSTTMRPIAGLDEPRQAESGSATEIAVRPCRRSPDSRHHPRHRLPASAHLFSQLPRSR